MHFSLLVVFLCCSIGRLAEAGSCSDGTYCVGNNCCRSDTSSCICRRCRSSPPVVVVQEASATPNITVISNTTQMASIPQPMPYAPYPGQPAPYSGQPGPYPGQPGGYPQPPPQYAPA
ncbi:histone acetyltransferase KAT6A-like isoform X5 [Dreissena polymorpha]|uniref:histone acetyltransferase KAT6A-like isoform X5 n=1 Tax=Dreissena polymorpha TaxID=45954 RepID=UPI0022640168|nr:histone acetyltransferase KAT6A-like isoform X5 [Dreissena polymorpha]